ncbi:MAG: ribosome-associated translation inhibitor RaiA [Rickettsiales bacterium]|nr:ribosome-associated translation inhibitor RaiA [Rickettsiales bacterium]
MQIIVSSSNMDVGHALTTFAEEHIAKDISKYFEKAIRAEVHFSKEKHHMFKTTITINEAAKGGITVKSDAEAGDAHACFIEALQKAVHQLRRYKDRIKNYRRNGGGIKNIEPVYESFEVKKYVLPPLSHDVFAEMEEDEKAEETLKIIQEKITNIETITANEAVMKMDLADLPALVFVNKDNGRINVVYHRKDGNISLIDVKK